MDTICDTPAEDYFSREDGFIYECEAYINDKTYKFYVSDDSNISADALFRTMKKEYNDLKNAKEVAKIREQAKKDYGITEEMLWMDPLFESTYHGSGNPMEMMNRACGKGIGWD